MDAHSPSIMHRDIFDYMSVPRLHDSLGVIPYYGGRSSATHADSSTGVIYLIKTFHSLSRYLDKVLVAVANERDYDFVTRLPGKVTALLVECNPIHLPVAALTHMQKHEKNYEFQHLMYSEADHILYTHDLPGLAAVCGSNRYVVPHRFTRLHPHLTWTTEKFEVPCPMIRFDEKIMEIRHYTPRDNPNNERFYRVRNKWRSFGGAWLATRELFLNTAFNFVDWQPIEEACHSMFSPEREMLRTYDPYDFFVEHLSGFEQVLRDRKIDIRDLPGAW